ncbi:MAG: DUF4450 domain-containing protein [Chthoniobacterales bacterium]
MKPKLGEKQMNRYVPIEGGWCIRIGAETPIKKDSPDIGVCIDDPRKHRRPLYPPADRSVFLEQVSAEFVEKLSMRSLVVAFNAPRFLFDFHHAGGALGHLLIGLAKDSGESLWLYDFADIEVVYVNGRMEYELSDPRFPGVCFMLSVITLADASGAVFRWNISGADSSFSLVFCYGGAYGDNACYGGGGDLNFHPEQCIENHIESLKNGFALSRTFEPYTGSMVSVSRRFYPEGWRAEIFGGCTPAAEGGFGDPGQVLTSPSALLGSTSWFKQESETHANRVAVQRVRMSENAQSGYMAVGMGKKLAHVLSDPAHAYDRALERADGIAGRVRIQTPDPYLNASAVMMAFGVEGTWGGLAYLTGAWAWRFAYLGWRTWYGPDCYGWEERVKASIKNQIRLSLHKEGRDKGAMQSIIEFPGATVYYNMNEVFLDHVRHYFDYTNDVELMREIYPVLKGIIEWETLRLKPTSESLYENALNVLISDSHWGLRSQATQASAYMLNAHKLMARIAPCAGEDAKPWATEAERIREAMQRVLWQKRKGVFAELQDTTGHKQLHSEPELPTIYHSAEFGAADALQIHQMLHWVDTHIEAHSSAHGGKQVWTSEWYPNRGRDFTHTTRDLLPCENLNYALTNYIGGRAEEGWRFISATLCGIFNSPTPGGLSCHSNRDGTQRDNGNDEYADSLSMWPRAVLEGLFGIAPNRPEGIVNVCPQFPATWPEASVETPHFSYHWKRSGGHETIEWKSPISTRVRLRLPVHAKRINSISIEGEAVHYESSPGIGLTWVTIETPEASKGSIEIDYIATTVDLPTEIKVKEGQKLERDFSELVEAKLLDPQGILHQGILDNGVLKGVVSAEPGAAVIFVEGKLDDCPVTIPLPLQIEAKIPVASPLWISPGFTKHSLESWNPIDLQPVFNAPVVDVVTRVMAVTKPPAEPSSLLNFGYRNEHFQESLMSRGKPGVNLPISDAAWRAKVEADGIGWTAEGIPFKSSKEGDNIATVTLMGEFPEKIEIPVNAKGQTLYLMISGLTWPAQSHVVNLRLTLHYENGEKETRDFVNPFDIGDCWDTWLGYHHDTAANGFENIGGRFGPSGSNEVKDMTQPIEVDTEAHLLAIPLKNDQLSSLTFEAIANDVIFGLMGATIRT